LLKLADLLHPKLVAELSATTKASVLEELAELLSAHAAAAGNGQIRKARVLEVLLERERLGSTGIGEGVALPHGKLAGLGSLMLGLGRSTVGVDFEAVDGQPARLFFLLLSPEGSTRHLQALAALARLLRETGVRQRLLAADSAQAMYQEMLRALAEV
jgi:PTS system nitrogen regulatory IIA component